MATAAEITTICIDNSFWMQGHPNCDSQVEAIAYYCETKFKCNPKNLVGLFRMASKHYGTMLSPTSDLQRIKDCLRGLPIYCSGQVDFSKALRFAWSCFLDSPPNIKRRILAFVGGPINLNKILFKELGMMLKEAHVALDVINFYVIEDTSRVERSKLYGKYYYARKQLGELVTIVNDNDNSHIVDVDRSSLRKILSEVILKKNVRYLRKKDQKKEKENDILK